ncbi:hypothetical protein N9131_00750 [bacterium]|nr:hypothetical protein [bacterium]
MKVQPSTHSRSRVPCQDSFALQRYANDGASQHDRSSIRSDSSPEAY